MKVLSGPAHLHWPLGPPYQKYEHLFNINDKSKGGSFYLQSKVRLYKETCWSRCLLIFPSVILCPSSTIREPPSCRSTELGKPLNRSGRKNSKTSSRPRLAASSRRKNKAEQTKKILSQKKKLGFLFLIDTMLRPY